MLVKLLTAEPIEDTAATVLDMLPAENPAEPTYQSVVGCTLPSATSSAKTFDQRSASPNAMAHGM